MSRRATPEAKALAARLLAKIEHLRQLDPGAAKELEDRIKDRHRRLRKARARRGL
jgi:hypothetical protein